MHFHADRGGFPGSYCGPDWSGVQSGEDIGGSDLACTGLGKTSAPVCRFHWLLSSVHPGLCWSVGATDGIDPERGPVCPTARQQVAFDTLKTCLINAPILGFPTEDGQFILDTDVSLFAVGGGGGGECLTKSRRIVRS